MTVPTSARCRRPVTTFRTAAAAATVGLALGAAFVLPVAPARGQKAPADKPAADKAAAAAADKPAPAAADREASMERQREQQRKLRQQQREQQYKAYQSMVANMPKMD